MPLPPIVQDTYTVDQYRYIAGFLLRQRAGILQALQSVADPSAAEIPAWQDPQVRYFRDAESLTRMFLWQCGYPVEEGGMYDGEITWIYPASGP